MPTKKKQVKLTEEELFPHGGFPYRLEYLDENKLTRLCWFQCEHHLTKHVTRYKIASGKTHVASGSDPLATDPFAVKPKRTRKAPAKPKAKTTTKKPSATKVSKVTKTKKATKPVAKTKSTTRARKTTKKETFSNLDTFFDNK